MEIVKICVMVLVVCVLACLALKGMKRLLKESDARESSRKNSDAFVKHGFELDEQEKRRIEENR